MLFRKKKNKKLDSNQSNTNFSEQKPKGEMKSIIEIVATPDNILFPFLLISIGIVAPISISEFFQKPLGMMLSFGMMAIGLGFFLPGIKLLRDPVISFARKRGDLYAIIAYPDKQMTIKPAYWLTKDLIKINDDIFSIDPNDVFIGPGNTKWVAVGHGSGLSNGLSMFVYPHEYISAYLKPNAEISLDGKNKVAVYINPDPVAVKSIIMHLEEEYKKKLESDKNAVRPIVINGVHIPLSSLTRLTTYDFFTEKKAEMKAERLRLEEDKKWDKIINIVFKIVIPLAIVAVIIITALKQGNVSPEQMKAIIQEAVKQVASKGGG